MKGLFVLNQPRPRYTAIWYVKIVLDYLTSLGIVNKLDLKVLTLKLTMLLCFVTVQRSQTLHLLKLSNMISDKHHISDPNILFSITDLAKHRQLN